MTTLRVVSGPAAGASCEVQGEVVIGREHADLTIADAQVSRRHAIVRPVGDGVAVEDLGSLNGTYVNGVRIAEPVTIAGAGTIRVGDSEIEVSTPARDTQGPSTVISPPRRGSVRRLEDVPVTPPEQVDRQPSAPVDSPAPEPEEQQPRRRRWLR